MFRMIPLVKIPLPIFCAVFLIAIGISPAVASPGPTWRETTLSVVPSQSSISVSIPEGAKRVAVEVQNTKGAWVRLSTRKTGSSNTFSMKVPKSLLSRSWRAWAEVPSSLKYPVAFYRGKKAARSVASSGYGEQAVSQDSVLRMANTALASTTTSSDANTKSQATSTQEADIWKSDGTTVYFFNQLRGLQVLDLADPAKPSLVAQLRLPAVGQDLYILPMEGGVAHAVLLASKPGDWDASEIHLVRIADGKASVVATIELAGAPSDSRLKGNRLFVATQTWKNYSTYGSGRAILNEISIDAVVGKLTLEKSLEFSGDSSVVSAGDDWLALAVNKWSNWNWNASEVHLFNIGETGLQSLNAEPIRTAGCVADKFKMQVRDGVFTAISQGWQNSENNWAWWGTPVTMLENFSTDGSSLASLEIIRGEQLYATRFAGDTAYAVTFRQTDPLWVIDLKVPYAPVISGHLDVPGWSTYIEPIGDLLFSIGWDQGRVAASLFDVSNPANPTLASRVFLSDSWGGFSESLYDEKALKILPDQNLALIPFTVHSWASEDPGHRIQILEIDSASRTLRTRGRIAHDFEPRRAAMVGGALASISQRQLVTADISDPDQPAVLADLLLAWPVHRVLANGDYLYQISDGSTWWDSTPALRISTTADPDTILNEIPLGSGTVRDAAIQGGRLHILRAEGLSSGFYGWMPILRLFVSPDNVDNAPTNPKLHLDVYDITSSAAPVLAGTSAVDLGSEQRNLETGRILFSSGNSAVVLARSTPFYWISPRPTPMIDAQVAISAPAVMPPWDWSPEPEPAIAAVFVNTNFTATTIPLDQQKTIDIGTAIAGDGIVLYACGDKLSSLMDPKAPRNHYAGLLDVSNPVSPLKLEPVSLPGRLLAATDLDKRGFLAWTENLSSKGEVNGLDLNASDLKTSYLVSSLTIPNLGKVAAMGRKLYAISAKQIREYEVPDTGIPRLNGTMPLDWTAESIRILRGDILVGGGESLLRASMAGFPSSALELQVDQGFDLDSVETTPSSIFAPAGEYGIDLLDY